MEYEDRLTLKRMAAAQEEIALSLKQQIPGRVTRVINTMAAVAAAMGFFSIADIVLKWIRG